MNVFLLKLLLTPLLIMAATLAARRWGPVIGGCLAALPLSSGVISFFLAFEQGPDFGLAAATNSVLGQVAVIVFCVAYFRASMRFSWLPCMGVTLVCYFTAVKTLSYCAIPVAGSTVMVLALLTAALYSNGHPEATGSSVTPPWWDIPIRMAAATGLLLIITGVAPLLGPGLSGLLSVFPVFTFVMALFTHKQYGGKAVRKLMHGIMFGIYAGTAFFATLALLMQSFSLPVVYLIASLVCAAVGGGTLKALSFFRATG